MQFSVFILLQFEPVLFARNYYYYCCCCCCCCAADADAAAVAVSAINLLLLLNVKNVCMCSLEAKWISRRCEDCFARLTWLRAHGEQNDGDERASGIEIH